MNSIVSFSNRILMRAYRAAGANYPFRAAVTILLGGHLIALLAIVLLEVQLSFTNSQFWQALAVLEVLVLIDNLVSFRAIKGALRPVHDVLAGRLSDQESTVHAWRMIVGLPSRHFRRAGQRSVLIILAPFVIWLSLDLNLPWWGALLILLTGSVILLYGFLLRFFMLELVFRPPVAELARRIPAGIQPRVSTVSVSAKLLLGLPIINVITGLMVAILSHQGDQSGIENIGSDVILVVVVATTVSLGLSLLLSQSLLLPINSIREAARRARNGDFSARVPVMTGDEIGNLASGFNQLMAGMQQRARLESALGEYVDPTVAAAVLDEDTKRLEGREVDLTVMFLDIRGFTSFAERAAPRAVVARLNEFFDIVIPAIVRHGGTPNKFTGDGLLALFGAPASLDGHADKAVDAALEIVTLLRSRFAGHLEAGIGINSGPAVAGTIGGGGSSDFTVVGDTVNTSQRVERATRETGDAVLVAGATHARLTRDHGGFEERLSVPMQGKRDQVRLWAPRALEVVPDLAEGDLRAVAAAAPDGLSGDVLVTRKRRD